jgi:hypothetical protein
MGDRRLCALAIVAAVLILSACVQSQTLLLKGTNVFGDEFELHLFGEFVAGKAINPKSGVYRWSGARYEHVSGKAGEDIKFVRIESLGRDDLLVEGTDDKEYAYFLAHKIAEATYRFVPVEEKNAAKAEQKRLCVKQDRDTCMIGTRPALDTLVRASLGKASPYTMIAVIAAPAQ